MHHPLWSVEYDKVSVIWCYTCPVLSKGSLCYPLTENALDLGTLSVRRAEAGAK